MRFNNTLSSLGLVSVLAGGLVTGCSGSENKDDEVNFDYRAEKDGSVSKVPRPVEYKRITGIPLSIHSDIDSNNSYSYLAIALDEGNSRMTHTSGTTPTLVKLKKYYGLDFRNRAYDVAIFVQAEINDGDYDTISVETDITLEDTSPSTLGHNSMRVYGIRKIIINDKEYDLTK